MFEFFDFIIGGIVLIFIFLIIIFNFQKMIFLAIVVFSGIVGYAFNNQYSSDYNSTPKYKSISQNANINNESSATTLNKYPNSTIYATINDNKNFSRQEEQYQKDLNDYNKRVKAEEYRYQKELAEYEKKVKTEQDRYQAAKEKFLNDAHPDPVIRDIEKQLESKDSLTPIKIQQLENLRQKRITQLMEEKKNSIINGTYIHQSAINSEPSSALLNKSKTNTQAPSNNQIINLIK